METLIYYCGSSKYANAKSFDEPLVYYRVHENNFPKKIIKCILMNITIGSNQKNSGDKLFLKNIKYFQSRLDKLKLFIYYIKNEILNY